MNFRKEEPPGGRVLEEAAGMQGGSARLRPFLGGNVRGWKPRDQCKMLGDCRGTKVGTLAPRLHRLWQ